MGKRFLKENILNPILDIDELNRRYNLCELLLKNGNERKLYHEFEDFLQSVS